MFAMADIGVHSRCKAARLLAQGLRPFVMSARRTKMGCRQFMQHSFTNAYTGNNQLPRVQQFLERREQDRGHAHNFGAIAPHAKTIHAAVHIEPQNLPEQLPQTAEIQSIETRHPRTRGNSSERLCIASASHSGAAADLHRTPKLRAQHGANVRLQRAESLGCKRSGQIELFHQANRAERKRESAIDSSSAQETHLQAAAAEIENQTRGKSPDRHREDSLAYEPRLFRRTDRCELDAGLV